MAYSKAKHISKARERVVELENQTQELEKRDGKEKTKYLETEKIDANLADLISTPVVTDIIFGYLRVNELLRLRRVSTWTKRMADEYLRKNPNSVKTVSINMPPLFSGFGSENIKDYLDKDAASSIKMPTTHFKIMFDSTESFKSPLIQKFLQQYGNQIEHLHIAGMNIPMGSSEFDFYVRIPNLKSLQVDSVTVTNPECVIFPSSFNKLKCLKVIHVRENSNGIWKLFEACTGLERYRLPRYTEERYTQNPNYYGKQFDQMKNILRMGKHAKFTYLDASLLNTTGNHHVQNGVSLCDLVRSFSLKLENFYWMKLSKKEDVERITQHVVSFEGFLYQEEFQQLEYANLEKITEFQWSDDPDKLTNLTRMFQPKNLPALKILEISLLEGGASLEYIWSNFPTLEEVTLLYCSFLGLGGFVQPGDGDTAFLGSNLESPAFLNLTRLTKLMLVIADPGEPLMTDVVFENVFKEMSLREFYIRSIGPVESFTSAGIQSLLTGRFMETIEKFPFHEWSLADQTEEEFLQLSRKFPNNQEF